MVDIQSVHTAWLRPDELRAIRVLLDEAFDGEVTDDDYEHALGGIHAMVWEGSELIGHGSVVMRRLLHRGRALRTGYVEAVVVRSDRRRRGHGSAVMQVLERVIHGAYEVGALGATDEAAAFYTAARLATLDRHRVRPHPERDPAHGRGGGLYLRVAGGGGSGARGPVLRLARRRRLVAAAPAWVAMTTVASRSSDPATRGISPCPAIVATACGTCP